MKRFLLFAYDDPNGGWNDFRASFDTLEEAVEHGKAGQFLEFWHVVDGTTGEFVA